MVLLTNSDRRRKFNRFKCKFICRKQRRFF